MQRATVDFETKSLAKIKAVGSYVYSRHPSTDILCMSYALDDGPIHTWLPGEEIPADLLAWLKTDKILEAHNAGFERAIWENVLAPKYGWPVPQPERWSCSAARAATLSLPRSLEGATKALGLAEVKDTEGHNLMMKLATPYKDKLRTATPEELDRLVAYCEQDVRAERLLSDSIPELSEFERKVWLLDQKINFKGLTIDVAVVDGAISIAKGIKSGINEQIRGITGGAVKAATLREPAKDWLSSQGLELEDTTAGTIDKELLDVFMPEHVYRFLELFKAGNKSSTAKYVKIKSLLTDGDCLRDFLLYCGASTGRWTGKGFQPHNLPRGEIGDLELVSQDIAVGSFEWLQVLWGDVMETLSHAIRGVVIASKGKELIVGDYAAIEARVLLWLAGDERALDVFRRGEDIYVDMASSIYHLPKTKVTKDHRFTGKQAILGLGYNMGAPKFVVSCANQGLIIDERFSQQVVDTYRSKYKNVPSLWKATEEAALEAIKYKGHRVWVQIKHKNRIIHTSKISYQYRDGFLTCILPSGRSLYYYNAKIVMLTTPWGAKKPGIGYMGSNSTTRQWGVVTTYGGRLIENATQAISRELLADTLVRVDETEGYENKMHVHDEVVAEVDEGTGDVKAFEALMADAPSWADGCPIKVKAWKGHRYRK